MSGEAEKDAPVHLSSSTDSQVLGANSDGAQGMTKDERETAEAAARYGYGPLSKGNHLGAFGGSFAPPAPSEPRKLANPAPLGLCGFALTTFVLSLINMEARGVPSSAPNLVVASAFGYGGLVQLLAGMWEVACGNTFGATALGSYGGFWISFAIIYTPGGFQIVSETVSKSSEMHLMDVVGFWLMGWWIFTTLLLMCTLKSSVVFFLLFFTLDLAFLFLGVGHLVTDAPPYIPLMKAGGFFGLLAAFLAWYTALAGIADKSNSPIKYPMFEFPWNESRKKVKTERETV